MTEPIAATTIGRVRGAVNDHAIIFLGIPYAAAPTGEHRFGPPIPHARWEGVRDTVTYGATALQPKQEFTLIPEPLVDGDNCLNLNVFTPDLGRAGLPVLVWIHGGGFFAGCNASPWYRGTRFARDEVVLVSINYRLGAEGFLHVADGGVNRGVLDWLAALEWVQHNIAAFGGDPDNVTIAGQSAGAMACTTLLGMPRAQGLFLRAISMSGPAPLAGDLDEAQRTGRRVAAELGIASTRSALASVPAERLLEAQASLTPSASGIGQAVDAEAIVGRLSDPLLTLAPVVDGDIIPAAPLDSIAGGTGSAIDLLAGTTAEEFNMVFTMMGDSIDEATVTCALEKLGLTAEQVRTYRDATPTSSHGAFLGQVLTDRTFRVPTTRLGEARQSATGRTHLYEFRWKSPAWGGVLGAAHCLDLPFVFDNLDAAGVEPALGQTPPQPLADIMHRAWVEFVTTGDPGWDVYDLDQRPTMIFDETGSVHLDPLVTQRLVWGGPP